MSIALVLEMPIKFLNYIGRILMWLFLYIKVTATTKRDENLDQNDST